LHDVLFRGSSEGKIRRKTIEEKLLEAVIGLPADLFFSTGIPAAVLIFNRGKAKNTNVLFINAANTMNLLRIKINCVLRILSMWFVLIMIFR